MSENNNKVTVRINGKDYSLAHDEPEDYIHRVAQYLNSKIAGASKGGIQHGDATAMVIAALNITDELFKVQKNFNTLKNEIRRMMDEYEKLKLDNSNLEEQFIDISNKLDRIQKELLVKEVEFNEYRKFVED